MAKLARNADGSYRGTYKGHEFTVRKEQVENRSTRRPETVWAAQCGTVHWQGSPDGSRKDAVRMLQHMLDMSDARVPEIDALLQRWTKEVQAIVPLLSGQDTSAPFMLSELKDTLRDVERDVRHQAVRFEEKLAKLKARCATNEPPATRFVAVQHPPSEQQVTQLCVKS